MMRRIKFILIAIIYLLVQLQFHPVQGKTNINRGKSEKNYKKILIYSWRSGFVPWFLYDPLLTSDFKISTEVKIPAKNDKILYPNLSKEIISDYDLVIIATTHQINKKYTQDVLDFLRQGGALISFNPVNIPQNIQDEIGINSQGTKNTTPTFSRITGHPGTRILGVTEGKSVYPHKNYTPHLKLDPLEGEILTRLNNGDPDIVVSSKSNMAIISSDAFRDLEAYHRGDIAYYDYRRNLGYLFVNVVNKFFSSNYFIQPVQKSQQDWSDLFYAYGAGREYVLSTYNSYQKVMEKKELNLKKEELNSRIENADQLISKAAGMITRGKYQKGKPLFKKAVKKLSSCMSDLTDVNRYLFRGWHSSTSTDRYYGGGSTGYAEQEWLDHLLHWLEMQINWVKRGGSVRSIDIYPHDWEIIQKYYPEDVEIFKKGVEKGYLEAVRGIYSAAFLPMLSEESNIRQFIYGRETFKNILNAEPQVYLDSWDHYDFHPQLPQILNDFGYKYAILSSNLTGTSKPVDADKLYWVGLDKSEIETVPVYAGLSNHKRLWKSNTDLIPEAEKAGRKNVLFGTVIDATADRPGEKEHTLLDSFPPIAGEWVTTKDFFEKTPKPDTSVYFGIDEIYGDKMELWSSFGNINQTYGKYRTTENLILAAEKFRSIASFINKKSPQILAHSRSKLDRAWKDLLATQDHMLWGAVDYTGQIPPDTLTNEEREKGIGKHYWGYEFDKLPSNVTTTGGMENYGEAGTENYAGPMVPTRRYTVVQDLISTSRGNAQEVLNKSLGVILNKINRPKSSGNNAIPFTIFNSLGFRKQDVVSVKKSFQKGRINNFILSSENESIPYQIIETKKYDDGSLQKIEFIFIADVPALGYKTYFLGPTSKNVSNTFKGPFKVNSNKYKIENKFYIIELDNENGGIKRIFDKELGKELLNTSQNFGNELISPKDPKLSSSENNAQIELIEKGLIRTTLEVQSKIGKIPFVTKISLYDEIKRIDFDLTVDYGTGFKFGNHTEAGTGLFVRFPFNFSGSLFVNQPFGIYETQKHEQWAIDFAELNQGKYGIDLIHINVPIYYHDDNKLSLILSQGRPLVTGKQNYRYSLFSHRGDVYQNKVKHVAENANTNFIVSWKGNNNSDKTRTLPAEKSFLNIKNGNIALSSIYMEGGSLYLRLYETTGNASHSIITLPGIINDSSLQCFEVQLNGTKERTINLGRNGELVLDFKPWEIKTLVIQSPKFE